jgi:hypothetical protein
MLAPYGTLIRQRTDDLYQARRASRMSNPDSSYWMHEADIAAEKCVNLLPELAWEQVMALLPSFRPQTWQWQALGFRKLHAAYQEHPTATAEQLAAAFLSKTEL